MKKLLTALIVLGFLTVSSAVAPSWAFLPKVDLVKNPSNVTLVFKKIKEKCEKAVQWVSNSKMGKLVGDGIKETKKGIAVAKNAYKQGMALYNQGMDAIEDAKNSKEYKTAMISKQIAEESKKLLGYQQQKLKAQEETAEKIKIAEQNAAATIQNIQNNTSVIGDYFEQQEQSGGNADDLLSKANAINDTNTEQLQTIQNNLEAEVASLKDDLDDTTDDLDDKIAAKTKKIADLTKELAKVAEVSITMENPLEAISNTQEEVFLKPGEKVTIRNRNNLMEKRYEERRKVLFDTIQTSMVKKSQTTGKYEDTEGTKDLTNTMPGESEGSGVHVEVLIRELEMLKIYTDMVLKQLELETTVEAAQFYDAAAPEKLTNFKLCTYSDEKTGLAALKEKYENTKKKVDSAKKTVSKVKDKVNDINNKIEDGKEMVSDVKDVAGGVKEVISNDPGSLGGIGGMM